MATTKRIQSLERAFALLESLCDPGVPEYSVKELSELCGLNKSTAFGLINTLTELGYLQQNPENQKYSLGLRLLTLSNAVKVQNNIIRTVHPHLMELSKRYGETMHCAVEDKGSVVYIDKVEAINSVSINSSIGMHNDLHCTGVGKCILAYLPPEQQSVLLAGKLRVVTPSTITGKDQLIKVLQDVCRNGYAVDDGEFVTGLRCVAVPVFSAQDTVACAISMSGISARIQTATEQGLIKDLQKAAAKISLEAFHFHI